MENAVSPVIIALLVLWELTWTGVACWHAARKNDKNWYILFCILTLGGIPEILYLLTQKKADSSA